MLFDFNFLHFNMNFDTFDYLILFGTVFPLISSWPKINTTLYQLTYTFVHLMFSIKKIWLSIHFYQT